MMKIGSATSKAVGFKSLEAVPWPTMEEVHEAQDREDGVQFLKWFRYLPSPPIGDTEKWEILDEINRITTAAMRG